jgi:hypothetical protein
MIDLAAIRLLLNRIALHELRTVLAWKVLLNNHHD